MLKQPLEASNNKKYVFRHAVWVCYAKILFWANNTNLQTMSFSKIIIDVSKLASTCFFYYMKISSY